MNEKDSRTDYIDPLTIGWEQWEVDEYNRKEEWEKYGFDTKEEWKKPKENVKQEQKIDIFQCSQCQSLEIYMEELLIKNLKKEIVNVKSSNKYI